jgi:hypothetical protein
MRSIEFPYTYYKGLYIPIIPLQLQHRDEWFRLWAFVDSGATFSIFSMREALRMGLSLSSALERMILVGDGTSIPASFVKLPARIDDVELEVEIGFSERLGVGFNLLGRKDVFERFQVCFSDSKRTVSFHFDESITQ